MIPFQPPPALLIIDVQRAIDDPIWTKDGPRNHPKAEEAIAALLFLWRTRDWPRFHIRHDSQDPTSPYCPGQPGNDFKTESAPVAGEPIVVKRTNSAFIGTDLQDRLNKANLTTLIISGVITNNSVEATVRMAGNLGFTTYLVEDACFTFARRDFNGRLWTAEQVHALSLANLKDEYCQITAVRDILTAAEQECIFS